MYHALHFIATIGSGGSMNEMHNDSVYYPKRLPVKLDATVQQTLESLPDHEHRKWIERSLYAICTMADRDVDRLDWKILTKAIQDITRAMDTFRPYRYVRKVAVFGSARTPATAPEYQLARAFAAQVADDGFMVITGAGGGIMAAANQGAGATRSFGLNIDLPFEQTANPYIANDAKEIAFKYFFTRKLFFLRESDAIALFPGGFGTMDEAFETITLLQTGKLGPAPLVLVQPPGNRYWHQWEEYVRDQILAQGLIREEDLSLYTIVEDADTAAAIVREFYRFYHSSRFVDDRLVLRLKGELGDAAIATLNAEFSDILVSGAIEKTATLPDEAGDNTERLPRLILHFNRSNYGRLHQLIRRINQLGHCDSLTNCAARQNEDS
jgi:uncharacterized protein (TIGR00730 family)